MSVNNEGEQGPSSQRTINEPSASTSASVGMSEFTGQQTRNITEEQQQTFSQQQLIEQLKAMTIKLEEAQVKTSLAEKAKEEAQEKASLAEKAKEEAQEKHLWQKRRKKTRREKERADEAEEKLKKDYILSGIPPLGTHSTTFTSNNTQPNKTRNEIDKSLKVNILEKVFNPFKSWDLNRLRGHGSEIWRQASLDWSHHDDLVRYVSMCFADWILASQMGKASVRANFGILSFVMNSANPDVAILTGADNSLMLICEVKRPHFVDGEYKSLDPKDHVSQLGRSMMEMRYRFGRTTTFGVLTDYKEWYIFWPQDCDKIAKATDEESFTREFKKHLESSEDEDSLKLAAVSMSKTSENQKKDGVAAEEDQQSLGAKSFKGKTYEINLCMSKKYIEESPALSLHMVSLLRKISKVSQRPSQGFLSDKFLYPIWIEGQGWSHGQIDTKNTELSIMFPDANMIKSGMYFIQDYHGLGDGRVYLIMTRKGNVGNVAVIKIFHDNYGEEKRAKEKEAWKTIWDVDSISVQVNEKTSSIMPFALHLRPKSRHDDGRKIYSAKFSAPQRWSSKSKHYSVLSPDADQGGHIGGGTPNDDVVKSEEPLSIETTLENDQWSSILKNFDKKQVESYLGEPVKALREAMETMARAGWYHNDLRWRHLALLPVEPRDENQKWTVKPILLDLADLEPLPGGPVPEGNTWNKLLKTESPIRLKV